MLKKINIHSQNRYQLIDITKEIEEAVREDNVVNGLAVVFVPHSTAGLILTENEEGLKKDWISFLSSLVQKEELFHNKIDNNADSHLLSGLLGQNKILIIDSGHLLKGTWQQIFLVELDGPRERTIIIKILEG
jgi:secondary thiamine-phosphate synthase enzyme